MHSFFFIAIFLLSVSGCTNRYPHLTDVPAYTNPSISAEQAKKEIDELKAERAANRHP
jgi:hypothetical protein